jgi:hypothetical protein
MEIDSLDSNKREEWNEFAKRSHDAWYWHTTQWIDYTEEYAKERVCAYLSFSVTENSKTLAICPLIVERSASDEDVKQFSFSAGPIPFPAMRNDLSSQKRQRVLKFYLQVLEAKAREEGVDYVSIRVPSVAKYYLTRDMPFANPLLKYGFVDLAYLTQVINLKNDLATIWADLRKGHKSDIKRAERVCEVKVWNQHTITAEKFSEYQLLHAKDAGRVTRSQRSFDLMLSWIRQGQSILVEAEHNGQPVAFSLMITFGTGAYYGSSCKDPDRPDIAGSHLIQWATIRWLKDHHFEWYDVGLQQFYPQWFDPAGPKDLSIAKFKRGFGGVTVPLVTGEYFYSRALLEKTLEKRWRRYLSALSAVEEKT